MGRFGIGPHSRIDRDGCGWRISTFVSGSYTVSYPCRPSEFVGKLEPGAVIPIRLGPELGHY